MIAVALDQPLAPERLERLLASAFDGGSVPRILLTKSDLDGADARVAELRPLARDVALQLISIRSGAGLDELRAVLGTGRTAALVGSSGAGKSSLVNTLLGNDYAPVAPVRERDGKGRHTTSWRELIPLPSGGVIIDTPGMRSLGLFIEADGIEETFDDVEALVIKCRFSDCSHTSEPGCAIRGAIASGDLDARRFESYTKLLKEADYVAQRNDAHVARERSRASAAVERDGRARARRR
jgi:ribosome biogenesis GTPase